MQTRFESFIETCINILIGFGINFIANWMILPLFGFHTLTLGQNFLIGLCFTGISVVRSYVIRRWAQRHLTKFIKQIASLL
jgi:ABC-type antimicrobial peptide transport system permease subunit